MNSATINTTKPTQSFGTVIVLTFANIGLMIGLSLLTYYLLKKYYYDASTNAYIGYCEWTVYNGDTRCNKNPDYSFSKFLTVYILSALIPIIIILIMSVTLFR